VEDIDPAINRSAGGRLLSARMFAPGAVFPLGVEVDRLWHGISRQLECALRDHALRNWTSTCRWSAQGVGCMDATLSELTAWRAGDSRRFVGRRKPAHL